jgi:hypothetical protein
MARRFPSSRLNGRGASGGQKRLEHERDRFNDEIKHDKDGERGGSYPYDRQRAEDVSPGYYEGSRGKMAQESRDAGMIHEDHKAIANLPQEVMIKPYPRTGPYLPEELDDTIRGIDEQMDYDDSQRRAHFFPKKV